MTNHGYTEHQWDNLTAHQKASVIEQEKKSRKVSNAIYGAFSTDKGKRALALIREECYADQDLLESQMSRGAHTVFSPEMYFYHKGRQDLFYWLLKNLEYYETLRKEQENEKRIGR